MQLYTHVSPSHEVLYKDYFLPSAGEFEVTAFTGAQHGPGTWGKEQWQEGLRDKARSMLRAAESCKDDAWVWSDVDVMLFRPVAAMLLFELGDADLAVQDGGFGDLCSGFYIARNNPAVKQLLTRMVEDDAAYQDLLGDQRALNNHAHTVKTKLLPRNRFWSLGYINSAVRVRIRNNRDVYTLARVIPPHICMVHANFLEGIQLKIWMLQTMRQLISRMQRRRFAL
jgi:hypothetical protein